MLTITITPTMLTFKNLDEETANKLHDEVGLKWNEKGYYFVKGDGFHLYKMLLQLSYTYDIEII